MRRSLGFVSATMCVLALCAFAVAQTAPVSLQGRLTGVPDGEQQVTLNIWNAATGGTLVASAEATTTVDGGLFSLIAEVPLGGLIWSRSLPDRWWSIETVQGESERQRLTHVPYATGATRLLEIEPDDVASFTRTQAYVTRADDGLGTVFAFGSVNTGAKNELRILGPNAPASGDNTVAINLDFSSAGSSVIDASRDGAWGTSMRFYTNATNRGGDDPEERMVIAPTGNVGIGRNASPSLEYRLAVDGGVLSGSVNTGVLTIRGGSDLAEPFPAAPASIQPKPGMVLSIDPENPGALRVSDEAYDTKVAGVYSGGNGLPTGMLMGKDGCELTTNGDDRLPLAMTGRVWVYADDSGGEIKPGDRLTTSGVNAGYAARVADASRADGAVIGKAMTGIDEATGMVLVLVNLQ